VQAVFTNQKVLVFDYGELPEGQVRVNGVPATPPFIHYANIGDTITIDAVVPTGYVFEKWEFYERNPDGTVGSLVNVVYNPTYTFAVDRSYVIKMYVIG
jgi:hypothetical protein